MFGKMARLKKVTSITPRGREKQQIGETTQAGRAESSLGSLGKSNSDLTLQRSSSGMPNSDRRLSTTSLNQRTSYVPAITSSLNPSPGSSQSSFRGADEQSGHDAKIALTDSGSSEATSHRQSTGSVPKIGGMNRKGGSTLSPAQQILQQKSASAIRPEDMPSPDKPKLLRDLGRDYTRYPSNVSVSSRLNSLPPGTRPSLSATRALLLRTTTANPFGDSQADLEKWGYPDDSISALHPYFGGEKGFILYADELEADDKYHMPADDDNITYKSSGSILIRGQ
jgi:hypothetical protein